MGSRMPITAHPLPASSFSSLPDHPRGPLHPTPPTPPQPSRPPFNRASSLALTSPSRDLAPTPPPFSPRARAGSTAPISSVARSPPATLQWERRQRGWRPFSPGVTFPLDGNKRGEVRVSRVPYRAVLRPPARIRGDLRSSSSGPKRPQDPTSRTADTSLKNGDRFVPEAMKR